MRLHSCEFCRQSICQLFDAFSGAHRSRNDRGVHEWSVMQLATNLVGHKINSAQIAFGKSNHSVFYSEVIEDLQMFFALRHPTVICGNDKKRQINRANSCDHVAHEILVSWNINNARLNSAEVRGR